MGFKQRDGDVRAGVIDNTRAGTLRPIVEASVAKDSTVHTDEHQGNKDLRHEYEHQRLGHRQGE